MGFEPSIGRQKLLSVMAQMPFTDSVSSVAETVFQKFRHYFKIFRQAERRRGLDDGVLKSWSGRQSYKTFIF